MHFEKMLSTSFLTITKIITYFAHTISKSNSTGRWAQNFNNLVLSAVGRRRGYSNLLFTFGMH